MRATQRPCRARPSPRAAPSVSACRRRHYTRHSSPVADGSAQCQTKAGFSRVSGAAAAEGAPVSGRRRRLLCTPTGRVPFTAGGIRHADRRSKKQLQAAARPSRLLHQRRCTPDTPDQPPDARHEGHGRIIQPAPRVDRHPTNRIPGPVGGRPA